MTYNRIKDKNIIVIINSFSKMIQQLILTATTKDTDIKVTTKIRDYDDSLKGRCGVN